jgi:hypothetical protein
MIKDNKNDYSTGGDIRGSASLAGGGAGPDGGDAFHQSAGQRRDGDNGADNLLLCAGSFPAAKPPLHQLSGTPLRTQLFILLLLAYFIFTCGQFLEGFYDHTDLTLAYVTKNVYNMIVIAVFIIVLWRHYQK